jgi:acetoin utilization deacetylase AcuC-like enzyme
VLIVGGLSEESTHTRAGHPERPGRIDAVTAGIDRLHLGSDLRILPAYEADVSQLVSVHAASYLNELEAFCRAGGGDLDPDTYATADSWSAARRVAGAGLAAIDALREQRSGVAFVAGRPPGHHALRDRAMGFCLINNIAVAASSLTALGEKVLIVDWDVHHGNGTQAIFWDDPNVLYVSTHQWPLYPGSGSVQEIGGPGAVGQIVNLPLPPGATGDVLRQAIDEVAIPVIDEFKPTWVLVSAGFDAHRADPMADLALSSGDFAELALVIAGCSPQPGRLALFLEGGYDLGALEMSVAATLAALLGQPLQPESATSGGPGVEMVQRARMERIEAVQRSQEAEASQ